MIRVIRLKAENIADLVELSRRDGFPFVVNDNMVAEYCKGEDPTDMCVQTYGVYEDERLVSIMTASYLKVFFHEDSPGGRTIQLSGAFTIPEKRSKGYGKMLIDKIAEDGKIYFNADYLCCDTTNPHFFSKNGFISSNEDRMWKKL